MQEPRVTDRSPSFKDRSGRLALFGSLAILAGAACVLFGLVHLLFPLLARRLPGAETMPADTASYLMGGLLFGLLGGALVRVGAGSVRRRRWVRPLMLSLAWTWALCGACTLALLPGMLQVMLAGSGPGGAPMDPTLAGLVTIVMVVFTAGCGVILPALFIWVYNDHNLRLTCEAHDSRPDWTARCPPAVLGLSVGLGACGVLAALGVLRPVAPWFGRLLTGWPGGLVLLAAAVVCGWLARETFLLRMRSWWATNLFLALVGISTWLTLARAAPAELFAAMGYPEEMQSSATTAFRTPALWLTALLTVGTVIYMIAIRGRFRPDPAPAGSDRTAS